MLGVGLTGQRVAAVAREARPWLVLGLGTMVLTGTLLFLSEAVKCYYNTSFWVKMTALVIALCHTFLIRQPVALDPELESSTRSRFVAIGSMALWFTVAAAGRWIGYS